MTRINCVPPEELTRQHLLAEYRELPRVFGQAAKAAGRGEQPDDPRNPTVYTLGRGHVRFFYGRLRYLAVRHDQLRLEMRRRGYKTNLPRMWGTVDLPTAWWQDWTPTEADMALNRARIAERLRKGDTE